MSNLSWGSLIQPQPMFDILEIANLQEKKGNYVARMEIGDTPGFKNVEMDRLLQKYSSSDHRYSPSRGEPALIDAIFNKEWPSFCRSEYGVTIAPANFLIMASLASTTRPGDLVLIPDPGFPTYRLVCNFLKLKVKTYSSLPNEIRDQFESLKLLENEKPKVIIINNPSNPTGLAQNGDNFSRLISKLRVFDTKVIIDETYINLVYTDVNPQIPSLDAIRIRTFSKEYCAPGLRIGYSIANVQLSQKISDFISLTISCAPRFIQLAAAEYLNSTSCLDFNLKLKSEIEKRFNLLKQYLPKNSFLVQPNSGFYALIKTGNSEKAFEFFLDRNVATCPGSRFGLKSNESLRISIAGSARYLEKDFELLSSAYKDWLKKIKI